MNEKASAGCARGSFSPPVDAHSMRKHAPFRTNCKPWDQLFFACPGSTQISRTAPLGVRAVRFVWGWSYANTLLASRLMAANTSIAIVHQIDFMDSSRMPRELHVSCRILE